MKKKYYIAYGSNLHIEQMRSRCPDAQIVGTTLLEGWELLFKGSKTGSYLTIERKEESAVPVGVWEVSEADERNLDRYEGCPVFYYKAEMDVDVTEIRTGEVKSRRAFVYIMHEDRLLGVPSPYYVSVCMAGYRSFGFDIRILEEAYKKSLPQDE